MKPTIRRMTVWLPILAALPIAGCDEETPPVSILTEVVPSGRVQFEYSAPLAADGTGTIRWALGAGALPPGLSMGEDGVIAGTPTHSGEYGFTVEARDDGGTDTVDLSIEIPRVVLMSGFEPFGGYDTNPSFDSIAGFDEQFVSGLDVRVILLEVVWATAWVDLQAEIERLNPDVVIGTGMAGSDAMRYETLGRNEAWGRDNDDVLRDRGEIVEGGPATVAPTLPVTEMAAAADAGGYETMFSDNAGDFLCNWVLYNLSYYNTQHPEREMAVGFIHVPPAPYDGSFSVADVTDAHRLGLGALATWLDSGAGSAAPEAKMHDAPVYFGIGPRIDPGL